ncbi:MAG: nucleotidyltransferase domain-containing protein [Thermoanaerobaculia bacterium]|nr:nucleotidyltransferase domain-containing protein [Thermoanaerobaculia bacterium]
MFRDAASIGIVLRILADASVFRAGGVLVGTQAFTCIANMLGASFEKESLRTADVDVAHDPSIPLGLTEGTEVDMLERLRAQDPAFFALPGIDSREPGTSFKVRGRDLRVDFLTPAMTRSKSSKAVYLPHLRVAAQPLPGLDYVIEGNVDAAVLTGSGVRVNVPSPARFAFHKLWVSGQRPSSETAKAKKDTGQAEQLLHLLVDDRPGDVTSAWAALRSRKRLRSGVKAALGNLEPSLRDRLAPLLYE